MSDSSSSRRVLTPRQVLTTNELLSLGLERPTHAPEIVSELHARILDGTNVALSKWTEKNLYFTKSQYIQSLRCEGEMVSIAREPRSSLSPAAVVGTIAHRGVQLSYTHPNRPVSSYVDQALIGARSQDQTLDAWWAQQPVSSQSDMLMQIASKVTNFLDDFPPLDPSWGPRFEEPMSAKIGKLTISGRADLVIGRPRGDMKQTMLLIDLKTGSLKEEHTHEAYYYALVATLRYAVPPWRSLVYSLASGEYTEPDITEEVLLEACSSLIIGVNAYIETMTERRMPKLSPGDHCRWCPGSATCAVSTYKAQ